MTVLNYNTIKIENNAFNNLPNLCKSVPDLKMKVLYHINLFRKMTTD